VSGIRAGTTAKIDVTALGNAKSQTYTSGAAAAILAVTSPANGTVVVTNMPQTISVAAPTGATSVTFATTIGTFANGQSSETVPVVAGTASATLTASQAGTATVTIYDNVLPISHSSNLSVVISPPVSAANKILLSASQTSVPISISGGAQYSLTLSARAIASDGQTDQAVALVPIQFSMSGGSGSGEYLSPALAYTNNSGVATATFTSGTTASISNGISVTAMIQNTAVQTGTLPSNNNVLLTVGGQALSVAFGPASVLGESSDKTLYVQAYSVHVTDANNNPVNGQVVTLRMRPVAFSTGSFCSPTATYCSEDYNGNGSLDAGEDGVRITTSAATAGSCPKTSVSVAAAITAGGLPAGTNDTFLTPPNSDAGGVPSTVTTDANGIAPFNLTYLKGSAIWVVNSLTATVSSNGTETSRSTIFRLAPSATDLVLTNGIVTTCNLPASPYAY
jgi:hypothetical protein